MGLQQHSREHGRRLFESIEHTRLFNKFSAWALTEYQRTMLLDADVYVRVNIDFALAAPLPEAAAGVLAGAACNPHVFNTGIMVLKPSRAFYDELWRTRTHVKRCEHKVTDQSIINRAVGGRWEAIPLLVQTVQRGGAGAPTNFDRAVHLTHFVGEPKPWAGFEHCRTNEFS